MRGILSALVVLVSGGSALAAKPNIILILADDLGYGHVGCFGQKKIPTPHLDRLAAEGMKFTQFYSGAAVCAPARSTLMTGLHTGRTPVRNNGLNRYLEANDLTLAEVLKKAGYATGGFGKWGLGREDTPGAAHKKGFDVWFGQYSQMHAHFHYPAFLLKNGEKVPLRENAGRRRGAYAPDVIHQAALEFIKAHKEQPFFAYLAYTLPHVELIAPPASRRPFEGRWPKISRADPRPGYLGSDDAIAEFAAMVAHLDQQVGDVLQTLKTLGLDDNTLILFTSDNGPQPGVWTDIFIEFFNGSGPYRGAKGSFYEGGIRVPTIARWPGKIRAGTETDHLGYFPDLMPTLAELAGATEHLPKKLDGLSLAGRLLGQGVVAEHPYLYWEAAGPNQTVQQQAVRWGEWKGVKPSAKKGWELYNLKTDGAEQRDVAAEHPEIVRKIEAIAAEAHTPERPFGPGPKEKVDDYVQ